MRQAEETPGEFFSAWGGDGRVQKYHLKATAGICSEWSLRAGSGSRRGVWERPRAVLGAR